MNRYDLGIIGYSRDDLDSIQIKYYSNDGSFSTLLDSANIYNSSFIDSFDLAPPNDSFALEGGGFLHGDYLKTSRGDDVEIVIKADNKVFRLTNITIDGEYSITATRPCYKAAPKCNRNVSSVTVNGVVQQGAFPKLIK